MQTFALFGINNFGSFEIYDLSTQTKGEGGWASADVFRTSEEGSIYYDFVQTFFMDGP